MAKRFTDTEKWKKPFIRGLKAPYKLLWLYICDDCDHAGVWHVDLEVAEIRTGEKLNIERAIESFGDKIVVFDKGSKWFIPSFIEFQYGELNSSNRAHHSVLQILNKYNLLDENNKPLQMPLTRGLQGAMDMDKDMDKDKEQAIVDTKDSNKIARKKTKKEFVPPTEDEVVQYFKENGYREDAARQAFKYYEAAQWRDSHGNQVQNWKQKMIAVWFTEKNRTPVPAVYKSKFTLLSTDPNFKDSW